jgi:sec-independent protein translocase protein TatC
MVFVALVVAGVVVYLYYTPILEFLRSPLGAPLYYSSPAGSFAFVMKICFTGALIITIPILAYNLIMFIRPAFVKALSRKRIYTTSGLSLLFAIAGAAFAFYVILPNSLKFFAGFQVSGLSALISADSYLGFVTNIIVTFVLIFQLPLLLAFIDHIKPLQPKKLVKFEKWVVLGSLVIALLAPFTYDLVTSLLIALPIVVLYNISIVMVLVLHAQADRKERLAIHAVVVKPVMTPEIALDEQMLEQFATELLCLEKPVVFEPAMPSISAVVKTQRRQPEPVQPPAWVVERKLRQASFNQQVRVFSDISRSPRANRGFVA